MESGLECRNIMVPTQSPDDDLRDLKRADLQEMRFY